MQKAVNEAGNDRDSITVELPKVRYELVDKDGRTILNSESVQLLERVARHLFPDQEQDEDCTGKGWDVQVVGCDR